MDTTSPRAVSRLHTVIAARMVPRATPEGARRRSAVSDSQAVASPAVPCHHVTVLEPVDCLSANKRTLYCIRANK